MSLSKRQEKKLNKKLNTIDDIKAELNFIKSACKTAGWLLWIGTGVFCLLDPIRALLTNTSFASKYNVGIGRDQLIAITICFLSGLFFLMVGYYKRR